MGSIDDRRTRSLRLSLLTLMSIFQLAKLVYDNQMTRWFPFDARSSVPKRFISINSKDSDGGNTWSGRFSLWRAFLFAQLLHIFTV